jgi:hypothetical protein
MGALSAAALILRQVIRVLERVDVGHTSLFVAAALIGDAELRAATSKRWITRA